MALDRYNRSNFFKNQIVTTTLFGRKKEADLITNSFNEFAFKRPMETHTVTDDDILRPDLISIKFYERISFWWIIAKVNDIEDFWNDIEVGDVLNIPDIEDIEEFYTTIRKRNRLG